MPVNLRNRDFLKELDFTQKELQFLLDLSRDLKRAKYTGNERKRMTGKNVALIFEKTSTRTRCAFEVGAYDQGAGVTYLDPSGSQMGHKESIADTARVLSRFYDGIEYRGSAQTNVEELAEYSDVPVWNGLTDEWHPTQMLADFLTMLEHGGGRTIQDITYTYMGDARSNMGNSLLIMGAIMGADVRICSPEDLWPSKEVQDAAHARAEESGARIMLTADPDEAIPGSDFFHTDVWVSMGEPKEVWDERVKLLKPYQVNRAALEKTGNKNAKFMHCLPAFHDTNTKVGKDVAASTGMDNGLEVTNDVFESSANIAFDQAENRLHTIKAIMVATIGD
ncbi:MAG: ornithine carbamoyltransferase [Candidatus Nanopelagicales bacterium]|nr:ornithine carbamoyltransferase [Candidatus Nanopelagicales bacterium]MCU0295569.1 ornithine carbamoyltransferase [Candidatus Nanopelagicales bacterium]